MDKPWKVVFAFIGVFVAGAVFGGLLALRVGHVMNERRIERRDRETAMNVVPPPVQPPATAGNTTATTITANTTGTNTVTPPVTPPNTSPGVVVANGGPGGAGRGRGGPQQGGQGNNNGGRGPAAMLNPQWQAAQLLQRYIAKLDLTPEQSEHFKPLFERASADFRRQQQTFLRDANIVLQRLQEDLRKELNAEQIKKLDKWEETQRANLEKRQQQEKQILRENGGVGKQGPAALPSAPAPANPPAKKGSPDGE